MGLDHDQPEAQSWLNDHDARFLDQRHTGSAGLWFTRFRIQLAGDGSTLQISHARNSYESLGADYFHIVHNLCIR